MNANRVMDNGWTRALRRAGKVGLVLWFAALLPLRLTGAPAPAGPVRGFSIPWLDKDTFQLKARVQGRTARPIGTDRFDVSDGLWVDFFTGGDRTNLVIRADRCVVWSKEHRLESAGPLQVETTDGQLKLEGQGFSWDEVQGLVISNRVSAQLDPSVRTGGSTPNATSTGNADVPAQPLTVRSDRFVYQQGNASFADHVVVTDPAGELHCGRMRFRMVIDPGDVIPESAGGELSDRVERILVEDSVQAISPDMVVSADRGEYSLADRVLEFSGRTRWKSGDREGEAGQVRIDRTAGRMRATDQVRMSMPASMLAAGLLPTGSDEGRAGEGPVGEPARMEVRAAELQVEPESIDPTLRRAVFNKDVVVLHRGGEMRCPNLTLRYRAGSAGDATPNGPAEFRPVEALADGGVDILRGGDWVSASRATYEAESGAVRMTGPVDWRIEGREGRSDLLELNPALRETLARGNVRMRMPAAGLREAIALDRVGESPGTAREKGEPIEIFSDEFRYLGADTNQVARGGEATWQGGVRAVQARRLEMKSERLSAELIGPDNRVRSMHASGGVEVLATTAEGTTRARADHAEYQAELDELRLTGDTGVDLESTDADGIHRGHGEALVYAVSDDELSLQGNAMLDSPHGKLIGERVSVNRNRKLLSARGLWRIRVPARSVGSSLPGLDGKAPSP